MHALSIYLTVKRSCLCKTHGKKSYAQLPIKHYQSQKDYDIFTNIQVFRAVSEYVIFKLLRQGHHFKINDSENGYSSLGRYTL